jgi:hypothetical protein
MYRSAVKRFAAAGIAFTISFGLSSALVTPLAQAATVQEASLSMSGDAGDYVGQGVTYSYSTSAGDTFGSSMSAQVVHVNVSAANGDWWFLDFAAPAGQTLAVGTYDSATRYPFQDASVPGLSVFGNGRGCNTLTGSFTVTEIAIAAGGAIDHFDADFEQHCEGATPALRGHVHVVTDPPPPPLSIGLGLASTGSTVRQTGVATVEGTITCNRPTTVWLHGTLTQRVTRFAQATGTFSRQVECSGGTPWQAAVNPASSVPFGPGSALLSVDASAFDAEAGQMVTDHKSGTVKLRR